MNNLFAIPESLPRPDEFSETLLQEGGLVVERIISHGHVTTAGDWYDQENDEWVALLQGNAVLMYDDGTYQELRAGDWTFIRAHRRHRVERTTADPPCIWLALHIPTLS